LSGQYPISEQIRIVADLPIARFGTNPDEEEATEDVSSTEIGNPYLGAHGTLEGRWSIGGGLRLPLASLPKEHFSSLEEVHQSSAGALALLTGSIGDISRFEAFSPNTFALRGYGGYTIRFPSGLSARIRPGLSLLSPTEDTESRENLLLLDYKGEAWYENDQFRVGAGVGGRINLNADKEESFEERTLLFFESAAQVQLEQFRPGVTFRLPLNDEPSDVLDYSVGINLTVTL
jgi:hypothetical protein